MSAETYSRRDEMFAESHNLRINSALAIAAARRGFSQEAVTNHTPLDALIEADERCQEQEGLGSVLQRMMLFFFADGAHPGVVLRRVYAVAKAIEPAMINHMSLEELALMFGETKAAQSWRLKRIFSDYQRHSGLKGFKARFQKSESARAAYSRAQRGNKNRKKHHARQKS